MKETHPSFSFSPLLWVDFHPLKRSSTTCINCSTSMDIATTSKREPPFEHWTLLFLSFMSFCKNTLWAISSFLDEAGEPPSRRAKEWCWQRRPQRSAEIFLHHGKWQICRQSSIQPTIKMTHFHNERSEPLSSSKSKIMKFFLTRNPVSAPAAPDLLARPAGGCALRALGLASLARGLTFL